MSNTTPVFRISPVFDINIKMSGMGGIVGIHADRLKRDLESLGYKVNFTDPNKDNAYWRISNAHRARFDERALKEIPNTPAINLEVEQCPWGG